MEIKKIKLIITAAIATIILLIVCSVFQIISIKKKQEIINIQQEEIKRLENELTFHQNQQNPDNSDDKQSDLGIEVSL